MKISCPNPQCRQSISIGPEDAGIVAACPACGQSMQLPDLSAFQLEAPAAPTTDQAPARVGGNQPDLPTPSPRYAGFWRRAAAAFVDFVVFAIIFTPVGLLLEALMKGASKAAFEAVAQTTMLLGHHLYYATAESSRWQATVGKKVLGLTVTDLSGARVRFGKAFFRNFCKAFSLGLWIGFPMIGFTKRKQGLHDKMADCLVIRNN